MCVCEEAVHLACSGVMQVGRIISYGNGSIEPADQMSCVPESHPSITIHCIVDWMHPVCYRLIPVFVGGCQQMGFTTLIRRPRV